jgi:excisionase family DNA binding protein
LFFADNYNSLFVSVLTIPEVRRVCWIFLQVLKLSAKIPLAFCAAPPQNNTISPSGAAQTLVVVRVLMTSLLGRFAMAFADLLVPRTHLSITELCAATTVSEKTLYRAIGRGELRALKIGTRTLIPIEAAEAWINGHPPPVITGRWSLRDPVSPPAVPGATRGRGRPRKYPRIAPQAAPSADVVGEGGTK